MYLDIYDIYTLEDAYYVQETVIHMEEDASLIYIDGITPGWAHLQEKNLSMMKLK